jgi:hypothetical protein
MRLAARKDRAAAVRLGLAQEQLGYVLEPTTTRFLS